MGPLKHVMITATSSVLAVNVSTVTISRKGQEEVCWHCPQGEATITFPKGSPFESQMFYVPKGGSVASGCAIVPVARGTAPARYKYSIDVTDRGVTLGPTLDPIVEVED